LSFRTIRLRLKSLSPLHIGAGEQKILTPLDYIVLDGEIKVVNHEKLVEEIFRKRLLEHYLNYLQSENNPSIQDFLKRNQLIRDRGLLEAFTAYTLGINTPSSRFNGPRIRLTVRTLDGQVYIPGSEVKGSFRTSIIFSILDRDAGLRRKTENELLESINRKDVRISGNHVERLLRSNNENNTDFMRLVRVSDMMVNGGLKTEVRALSLIRYFPGFDQRFLGYVEVIPEGAVFEGTLTLLKDMGVTATVKWGERVERLEEELMEFLKLRAVRIIEENLRKLRSLSGGNVKDLVEFYEELQRVATVEPVMPIGYGQGFWGTTVSILFPSLVRKMVERRMIKGRHLMPNHFPRTMKVVASAKNLMPLGWCSVEFGR